MNDFPLYLLLPLLAALVYAVGALALKRALSFGLGLWRLTFLANLVMGLLFLPLLLLGGAENADGRWYQPVLGGLAFFTGQIFTFLALNKGDVSVATPVMGIKVVLVALFSTILVAEPVSPQLWGGAFLTTVGILLLHGGSAAERRLVWPTLLLAASSASAFALTDVLVQRWAPLWGIGHFLPLMFGCLTVLSFVFVPFFKGPLWPLPRGGAGWVLGGCVLLALQALILAVTFGVFGDATAVNIVFSSRGLMSVVLVWLVGHWFTSSEQHLGRKVLARRLAGASLLIAAIALTLV